MALRTKALLGALIIGLLGIGAFFLMRQPQLPTAVVTIGSSTVVADVAQTESARGQGLSGRSELPSGRGMLFVFDRSDYWGIWMKDMQFSIDILYIDADYKVVSVVAGASPDTYRQNPPQVFYPTAPARYVLELPAGYAAAHNIATGTEVVVKY